MNSDKRLYFNCPKYTPTQACLPILMHRIFMLFAFILYFACFLVRTESPVDSRRVTSEQVLPDFSQRPGATSINFLNHNEFCLA